MEILSRRTRASNVSFGIRIYAAKIRLANCKISCSMRVIGNESKFSGMNQAKFHVLLAGGDGKLSATLSDLLKPDGITVYFARGAEEALQFIKTRPVDVTLIDLESAKDEGME